MNRHVTTLSLLLLVLIVGLTALAADRAVNPNAKGSDLAKSAATPTTAVVKTSQTLTPVKPLSADSTAKAAVRAPQSGEQIKWQVISGGGGTASSTNFKLSASVGQTATGQGSSTNYKVNQGFWQNFSTSCCIGKRGNVNMTGIVDLADLSSLVSYLTGGGYVLPCYDAANVNGVGIVDLADLSSLVSYLTGGGYVLPSCP